MKNLLLGLLKSGKTHSLALEIPNLLVTRDTEIPPFCH
jgi:hypothetical protein